VSLRVSLCKPAHWSLKGVSGKEREEVSGVSAF